AVAPLFEFKFLPPLCSLSVCMQGHHRVRIFSFRGGSLAIPCHYEPQYAGYVKYWCWGSTREFCTSLARTDDEPSTSDTPAQKKVKILDDPVQLVFTVTMEQLKKEDSGWYMCGVEIGGMWSVDLHAFTEIKVIDGMSVLHSRLSREEGSVVTVECSYSEKYRYLLITRL
uniref:Immunoglobulin V-set domain-containing protein n=1 Tax=Neogobius melanostomus TaxID=47308 RepID=A0A8C6U497_9GOBI